jgi:hypothetical protein
MLNNLEPGIALVTDSTLPLAASAEGLEIPLKDGQSTNRPPSSSQR